MCMFLVQTPLLYVRLGMGYSFAGWVGHGFNIWFIVGSGLAPVEIYGFGLDMSWVVDGWVRYGFGFPAHEGL